MESKQRRKLYLLGGSIFLLASILMSLGFLLSAGRINRWEGDALHESLLNQNSWLNRVALALSESRGIAFGPESEVTYTVDKTESYRALLSQATIAPTLLQGESLLSILGDDPLVVVPRLAESESEYQGFLNQLLEQFQRLDRARSEEDRTTALSHMDSMLMGFDAILANRATVLAQLAATIHARLRFTQRQTGHRIQRILLFQFAALLASSVLIFFAIQSQTRQVQELEGLVPICASCKNVRNDEGYWSQVETYIKDRTHLEFSHGICPKCVAKLYPELMEKVDASAPPGPIG